MKIIVSMIPVAIVGLTLKEFIEGFFVGDMTITGSFLLVTALFLTVGHFVPRRSGEITYTGALLMGIAQALAVLPGLSRSGTTISTGLMLGYRKEELTRFSFLMVIVPILGASFIEVMTTKAGAVDVVIVPLIIAFVTAFVSGYFACKLMIKIVSRGKLVWFAVYCALVGMALILFA
ncbi:MAG: undecaprenyl-diphosphate phosphatase [Bacteroidales bacterium]|nr:undecaprenyl-diphosphate phosphatase [Bacteroidales bacterium]